MELADEVKELLERRRIEMGHARALLGLGSRRQQIEVAALVAKKSLSVRDTEALVRRNARRVILRTHGMPAMVVLKQISVTFSQSLNR